MNRTLSKDRSSGCKSSKSTLSCWIYANRGQYPQRPQSDETLEQFNRALADEMFKYCAEGQQDWDLKLPAPLMTNWSAVHKAPYAGEGAKAASGPDHRAAT